MPPSFSRALSGGGGGGSSPTLPDTSFLTDSFQSEEFMAEEGMKLTGGFAPYRPGKANHHEGGGVGCWKGWFTGFTGLLVRF